MKMEKLVKMTEHLVHKHYILESVQVVSRNTDTMRFMYKNEKILGVATFLRIVYERRHKS